MDDLFAWLEGSGKSWPNYFKYKAFMEAEERRKRDEELRQRDEDWANGIRRPGRYEFEPDGDEDAETMRARALERFKETYMPKARPCPNCGTPPEYLEWYFWSSRPSSWARRCGRGGVKTRCKFCCRQVDFFLGYMN